MQDNDPEDKHSEARQLAEKALREQTMGNDDEADRLFAEAQRIDPEAVAAVLQEYDVANKPEPRGRST